MSGIAIEVAEWELAQGLFESALELAPDQRGRFFRECGAGEDVIRTVVRMLEADAEECSILDRGVEDLACELLTEPDSAEPQPPAMKFGPYETIRTLGEGGMGVVWLARRIDTDNLVAAKFLPRAAFTPGRHDRFTQEVKLLAKLKHPCIARLYDTGVLPDGTPWFVMEYVEGAPFAEYVRGLDSITGELRLFRAVCDAVQYAHGQQVIHRDLKPSNILIEKDGTPKLVDFGIAKELHPDEDDNGLTIQGPLFMSKDYADPEWVSKGMVGTTNDVYSLGVILYEILAGELPARTRTGNGSGTNTAGEPTKPSMVRRKRDTEDARAARKTEGATSRISQGEWNDLDVLCLTAMHREPQRRYRSVEALVRDLDHFLREEPLEARPDSWSYKGAKFFRRHALGLSVIAAAIMLLLAMATTFTLRLAKARNDALAEAARADRVKQFTLSLFRSSGQFVDAPNNLSVETFVDRGAGDAERLTQEPGLQEELFEILGQMYEGIGKRDKADALYSKALVILDKQPGSSVASLVNVRLKLGRIRGEGNRQLDQERLIREANEIIERRAPGDRALRARIEADFGGLLSTEGKFGDAEQALKTAAAMQESAGSSDDDLANTLQALSNLEINLGHYGDSEAASRKLILVYGALYGNNDPHVGDALQNLGECLQVSGRYAQAEQYERQALSISEAWYGKEHRLTANKMSALALVLIREKKFSEASKLLRNAYAIEEKAYPSDSLFISKTLKNMGMLQLAVGEYDEAIRTFDRVNSIYRAHEDVDTYLTARLLMYQGEAYRKKRELSRAESLVRQALQIFLKARGENDVYTALARLELGRTLLEEMRYSDAEVQTRTGIETLKSQSMEQSDFARAAREDLVAIYDSLKRPKDAQRLRDEIGLDGRELPTSR